MQKPLILIADPDRTRANLLASTFNGRYACIRVADADTALEVARRRAPQAVVVDFPFPLIGGRCLAAALCDDPATRDIPVIAYSDWDYPKTRLKARELGCRRFVADEDGAGSVVRAVETVLAKRQHAVA